jgi:hypothetical protein
MQYCRPAVICMSSFWYPICYNANSETYVVAEPRYIRPRNANRYNAICVLIPKDCAIGNVMMTGRYHIGLQELTRVAATGRDGWMCVSSHQN